MAITEKTIIGRIEILDTGVIQIRVDRVILDSDGTELQRLFSRYVLVPGQAVSTQPPKIQALCNLIWTPAVIAAYQAKIAALPPLG